MPGSRPRRNPLDRPRLRLERLEPRLMLHGGTDGGEGHGQDGAAPLPDFALVDVNTTSPTYDQPVSPRDSLEQVSVWLFGWST